MHIVMLGPPGAGKGTQSSRLALALGVPHLSTGDILRAAIKSRTKLRLQARQAVETGTLVSDELVIACVEERISQSDASNGFILDGFPRTVTQAETLDAYLASSGTRIAAVFDLVVDFKILLSRIVKRAAEAEARGDKVRSDDDVDPMRIRLAEYVKSTAPCPNTTAVSTSWIPAKTARALMSVVIH